VPPLRERRQDIIGLVQFLLQKMCRQLGVQPKHFSAEALAALQEYEWPGNVRELENVIERAVNICGDEAIGSEYLPRTFYEKPAKHALQEVSLREMERRLIEEALQKTSGNISNAAKLLGIGRNTLYSKLKEYEIVHLRHDMFSRRTVSVQ
jgi:DNA-binding NtrC family response regulator